MSTAFSDGPVAPLFRTEMEDCRLRCNVMYEQNCRLSVPFFKDNILVNPKHWCTATLRVSPPGHTQKPHRYWKQKSRIRDYCGFYIYKQCIREKTGAVNIVKEIKTVPGKVATTHTEDGHK